MTALLTLKIYVLLASLAYKGELSFALYFNFSLTRQKKIERVSQYGEVRDLLLTKSMEPTGWEMNLEDLTMQTWK